jgi:DNA helicase-2/ATP-dependent DNA helicase PcrA
MANRERVQIEYEQSVSDNGKGHIDIDWVLRTNLTEEQYNAVVDRSEHILCLACAGSGKSRTLAYKIAHLVSEGEPPESIIAFTFTERAAESIKRRVAEALRKLGLSENNIGLMFIGTLDSFCQKLLGDIDARYRQFDILDQNRLSLYVLSRMWKLGLKQGKGQFQQIRELTDAWQTMNNENIALEDVEQHNPELHSTLVKLYNNLEKDGFMDFSFAINLAVKELKKITHKKGTHIERFKHLFVDEYQDINPIQEEFIRILAGHLDILFVVGDDDQSIYGWRGANVENILTFRDRYEPVSVHRLLVNFRSTKAIVETANSFVKRTIPIDRLPKTITHNSDGNIQDLRKLWFETRYDEAQWVAERIQSLLGTTYIEYNADGSEKRRRGLTYNDFAVLIRSIRTRDGDNRDVQFVNAMRALNIPFKTTGEGGIFDRPHAHCILGIMELLRNKDVDRDAAEFFFENNVLYVFPTANKSKYLSVLQEWHSNVYADRNSFRRKIYPQNFLHQLADALMLRDLNDETALRDLGLFSEIIKDVEGVYVSIDSNWRYIEMLNFLQNIAKNYELEISDYITKTDSVNVSTIHKVKGLEFPVVFIVDLVSQRFPGRMSTYSGLLPDALMQQAKERGAYGTRKQDEARLFYTAVTRAERLLYLSGSDWHPGLERAKKRSEFITGLAHPQMREDKDFDELAEKIEPQPRFDDNELPTDFSAVKTYLTCPYMYKLQTVYGFNAAVPELFGFGQTTHTILEKLHQTFKNRVPTDAEITEVVESTFMLKHVFQSKDPNSPGPYERAKSLVDKLMKQYVRDHGSDFCRLRQDEARFELLVDDALITGAIDLILKEDENKAIESAEVIDFKSMEIPDDMGQQDWREMSVQVQLYSKAAKEVLGQNADTGFVHILKSNKRIKIPVDQQSTDSAIKTIEWAVRGILRGDFPMRASKANCSKCDYQSMCGKKCQDFQTTDRPPKVNTPTGPKEIAAFDLK